MTGCDGFECGLEPGVWLDLVQLRRLDEGCYASPGGGAVVVTGEQGVFPCKDHGPQAVFDGIAIHFDAAVVEEDPEAVPMTGDIGELFAEPGLGRDADALLRQPFAEGLDQVSVIIIKGAYLLA